MSFANTHSKADAGKFRLFGGKAAEQSKLEQARLAAILAASPDACCGFAADGTVYVSPDLPALFGLSSAVSLQRLEEIQAVLDAGDAAALEGLFQRLQDDKTPFDITVRLASGGRSVRIRGRYGATEAFAFVVLWCEDVSAAIQAQEALKLQEHRAVSGHKQAESALDALPMPIWRRAPDGRIIALNAAYAKAVDSPPEVALAEQRDLGGSNGQALAQKALTLDMAQSERRGLVLAGARRQVEIREIPLAGGGTLGVALDLTEADEARRELERHRHAHEKVLEHLATAVAIYGADQRLSFRNAAWMNLWDLHDERWLASKPTMSEVIDVLRERRKLPEQADFRQFKQQQTRLFTDLIGTFEELLHRPDGATLRHTVTPHPLGGLVVTLEDVTSRLQLESSFNTMIAVQRETLDNLSEAVGVFGEDGRLSLWNPACARIWKLDEKFLGSRPHVSEVVDAIRHLIVERGDWQEQRGKMVAGIFSRKSYFAELERSDGSVLEVARAPLPDGGTLFSFMDVTPRVKINKFLQERNAALEASDRLKIDFLSNVSYQLRTPLNAIVGFSEILHNGYYGALNDRQKQYTGHVLESANRLSVLVDAILDLSSIEAGYMRLHPEPVRISVLVDELLGLTQEWAGNQQVIIQADIAPDVGVVTLDVKRIKQILLNLISNAIKFTPAGGKITVQSYRHDDGITLAVSDTGRGIPLEDQQRVLGAFERAGPASGNSTGAGLGLALVRRFVELHGGKVTLESTIGKGTTIRCFLPDLTLD